MNHIATAMDRQESVTMNAMPDFVRDILTPVQMRQSYRDGMAKKLAGIIAELLNEHEPLLRATVEGTEITVSEKGGPMSFTMNVEAM